MEMGFSRSDFPDGFLFGTATSAYQIEGHAHGGAGRTHWDDFAATPGNVVRAENGAQACDHYHRYEDDLDLLQAAGIDAYRFSTSWARVMPDGVHVNPEGLDFYDRLTDAICARGIKPAATLYHWELPSALADKGGWRNRDIASWFADFSHAVMSRIGDRMHSVAPINEPWCVAWLSHFIGAHAPGVRDIRAAARAMHHVLLAHGSSIEAMRALGMQNLGAVFNFEYPQPASDNAWDMAAAARYDAIYNGWFIGAIFEGAYPAAALEALEPHLPTGWAQDFEHMRQPLDWAGVNYYTRKIIATDPSAAWPSLREVEGPLAKTTMGWEKYPHGLLHFIKRLSAVSGGLPIYVTENGMSANDAVGADGAVQDAERIAYISDHLGMSKAAIEAGVDLRGHFIWSLLDNYEWALGYEKRFGLVHVDFATLERTPKESMLALGRALQR